MSFSSLQDKCKIKFNTEDNKKSAKNVDDNRKMLLVNNISESGRSYS